jgi:hypothetical protein
MQSIAVITIVSLGLLWKLRLPRAALEEESSHRGHGGNGGHGVLFGIEATDVYRSQFGVHRVAVEF